MFLLILLNIIITVILSITDHSKKTPALCCVRAVCIFILLLQDLIYTPITNFFKFTSFLVFLIILSLVFAIWPRLFKATTYLGVTYFCSLCLFYSYEMLAIGYQAQVWCTILPFLKACGSQCNFTLFFVLTSNWELITFILLIMFVLLVYWFLSRYFSNLPWFARLVLTISIVFLLSYVIYTWNCQYLSSLMIGRIFRWMRVKYIIIPIIKIRMHVNIWWRRFYIWAALRESSSARWVYRFIVFWRGKK